MCYTRFGLPALARLFIPNRATAAFLGRAPKHYVSNITKFTLYGRLYFEGLWQYAAWHTEIVAGGTRVDVACKTAMDGCFTNFGFDNMCEKFCKRIKAAMEPTQREGGKFVLCKGDMGLFNQIFRNQLEDQD